MRKNTMEVISAFLEAKPLKKCSAIWTDGQAIYSYTTCLLANVQGYGTIYNDTKYSPTTSRHQHGLRLELANYLTVDGLPRGAGPQDLRKAYDEMLTQ